MNIFQAGNSLSTISKDIGSTFKSHMKFLYEHPQTQKDQLTDLGPFSLKTKKEAWLSLDCYVKTYKYRSWKILNKELIPKKLTSLLHILPMCGGSS